MPQDGVRTFLPLRPCSGGFTPPLPGFSQRSPGSPATFIIRCCGLNWVTIRALHFQDVFAAQGSAAAVIMWYGSGSRQVLAGHSQRSKTFSPGRPEQPPAPDSLISNREASQTRSRRVSSLPALSPCHISTLDPFPPPHSSSCCSPRRSLFPRAVVQSLPLPPACGSPAFP